MTIFLVNIHPGDLGRSQGIAHIFGLILRPRDDVNPFPSKFLNDALDSRALHAHASPHGVHITVRAIDRDLRSLPRLPRRTDDLDHSFRDLGDLHLKQLDQKPWMGSGKEDLRSL